MPLFYTASAGFLLALLVTGSTTPAVRRLAMRLTWTDSPDGLRKRHLAPTPSAGGLAIFAGIAISLSLVAAAGDWFGINIPHLHPIVYVGAVLIVAMGVYDDVRGLSFKPKLLVECLLAYILVHAGYRVDLSVFPFAGNDPYAEALYALPLTMLWIVGVINAVNLIDGVDGLAAGIAAIAIAALGLVFGLSGDLPLVLIAVCVVGALIGFLIHNFNPASIFMGDSGSLFLGYTLAVFSLSGGSGAVPELAPLVPALALGLPLFDTALSMVRRLVEGRAMFAPDCDHIHHRMTDLMPVPRAVLTMYGIAAVFGAAAIAVGQLPFVPALMVILGTVGAMIMVVVMLGYTRRAYQPPVVSEIQLIREPAVPPVLEPDPGARDLSVLDAEASTPDPVPDGPAGRPAERGLPSGDGSTTPPPKWRLHPTNAR